MAWDIKVSIHVPARGTTTANMPLSSSLYDKRIEKLAEVSIHVPARGTTEKEEGAEHGITVSIHVPARGTTEEHSFCHVSDSRFNPRSRKGNDQTAIQHVLESMVSIHVPARGTT